jgi:hypothetical protein
MRDSRSNISPGIFLLVFMIVFISFFQRDKDKHSETTQSVISYTNSSSLQAIMVPEVSSPGADLFWIKKLTTKFPNPGYDSDRGLVLNELICCCYNSHQFEFHANNPVIGLIFPQKVPEQGNADDDLSIA